MGLQRRERDVKYQVHRKWWDQAPEMGDIHIVENVTEYELEAYKDKFLGREWGCNVARVDPRLWGFSTARPRLYGILFNRSRTGWDENFPFADILNCLRAQPVMKATDYFTLRHNPRPLTPSEELQN